MLTIGNMQVSADLRNAMVTGLRVYSMLTQICATVRRVRQDTVPLRGTETLGWPAGGFVIY